MKMKALYAALSGAILLSAATLTAAATDTTTSNPASTAVTKTKDATNRTADAMPPARTMAREEYTSEKSKIEADYKAANAKCKDLKANAKDVCHKEAKADEKIKKADLEAKYKGTPQAAYDAQVAKAKAQYDVASEKCEDMKGKEQSACKKQAKADEAKALADAKAAKGTNTVASAPAPEKAPGK